MPLNNTKMKNFARIDILSNYSEKDTFSKQLVTPYINTKRQTDGLAKPNGSVAKTTRSIVRTYLVESMT